MDFEAVKADIIKKGAMARVLRFYTTYARDVKGRPIPSAVERDKDGKVVRIIDATPRVEEMVELAHPGLAPRSTISKNIKELQPDPMADTDNESTAMTRALWEIIEPSYRGWKTGQAVPESGTRLAAWPGLGAEQADVLRSHGIRTLEEFSNANDSVLTRIPLPAIRALQQDCKIFMDARDVQGIASSLAAKDEQLRLQDEQIAELRAIVMQMQEADKPKGKRRTAELQEEAA